MNPDMKRLHLSTLLVLVLIAGTWVTLNMRDYKSTVSAHEMVSVYAGGDPEPIVPGQLLSAEVPQRGFPIPMYIGRVTYAGMNGPPQITRTFEAVNLAINFIACLFVLGLTAYALEFIAQKKQSPSEPAPTDQAPTK